MVFQTDAAFWEGLHQSGYSAVAYLGFSKPDFSEFLHLNQGGDAFVGDFRSTKVEFFEGEVFSKMFDSGISDCSVAEVGVVIV